MIKNSHPVDARTPLLSGVEAARTQGPFERTGNLDDGTIEAPLDRWQSKHLAQLLYISHFLSTWNSRLFQFGAILFVASIFTGTLLPTSAYALASAAAAIVFSPMVGNYIDSTNLMQRFSVAISCAGFWILKTYSLSSNLKSIILVTLTFLACVEKLGSVMNTVAVEKDWVVVMANNTPLDLAVLNSQMRRIDLFCKLMGPLIIALIDGISTQIAILSTLGLTLLPSFALSILYFTVLSFSGQMVTYLLAVGYTSAHIGIVRTASVLFEMSATWIAPRLMNRLSPLRAAMWFLSWQIICLAIGTSLFLGSPVPFVAASGLVGGVIASRVGLWGFDLSVQIIVQEEVEPEFRGTFSSIEASVQNFFSLGSYASTMVFSRPEQFRYPVVLKAWTSVSYLEVDMS
ncbi:hypothetical protein H0H92_013467 [Tricholoma furcatifolium]|nr:hypothetical protein H0H92_013467 [Tricholoma furcatifolium]